MKQFPDYCDFVAYSRGRGMKIDEKYKLINVNSNPFMPDQDLGLKAIEAIDIDAILAHVMQSFIKGREDFEKTAKEAV